MRVQDVGLEREMRDYGVGLLTEESGEMLTAIGRGVRFGFETPDNQGDWAIDAIERKAADMLAAIEWCMRAGVIDRAIVTDRAGAKLSKLCDPERKDNCGRPLAPVISNPK